MKAVLRASARNDYHSAPAAGSSMAPRRAATARARSIAERWPPRLLKGRMSRRASRARAQAGEVAAPDDAVRVGVPDADLHGSDRPSDRTEIERAACGQLAVWGTA